MARREPHAQVRAPFARSFARTSLWTTTRIEASTMSPDQKSGGKGLGFCAQLDELAQKIGGHRAKSGEQTEPVDNHAAPESRAPRVDVRAHSTETFANLTHLPHLPHLRKDSLGQYLHPTSRNASRDSATVDGRS